MALVTSIRMSLSRAAVSAFLILGGAAAATHAQQPADTSPTAPSPKPKKVWTNDDLVPESTALTAIARTATAKTETAPTPPLKNTSQQTANQVRNALEKLQAQWKDADARLERLKRFQSGDTGGDAGRQLHKGYNTEPIPDQIAQLEGKMHLLQLQIDAIYDQARKKGIPPDQLR